MVERLYDAEAGGGADSASEGYGIGEYPRSTSPVCLAVSESMFPFQGKLSEEWASVTKAGIAENILNLTRLDEKSRDPTECLRSPTLWLALASLCVLDSDHVERLSSGQWRGSEGQAPPPRVRLTSCSHINVHNRIDWFLSTFLTHI